MYRLVLLSLICLLLACEGQITTSLAGIAPKNHRPSPEICDEDRVSIPVPNDQYPKDCTSDEECTLRPNGRCRLSGGIYSCNYDTCYTDADCKGIVCGCNLSQGDTNICVGGSCTIDADCGPGGYCSPSYYICGRSGGYRFYACHTPQDECLNDEDCGPQPGDDYCAYDSRLNYWVCKDHHCQ